MKLGFPIKTRIPLPLATFMMIALFGLVILSALAFAPAAPAQRHSSIYISDCPGTVTEEGPRQQVIATVNTTLYRTHLAYHLYTVTGTATGSDFSKKGGIMVTGKPDQLETLIIDDDHLDDGEYFVVTVGSSDDDIGRNADQRCMVTIRDNDPPRAREMRLVSEPADGETYRLGEKIEIEVEFDNKVRIVGDPAVPLWFTVPANGNPWNAPTDESGIKRATYVRGNESKVLKFSYEVTAEDRDSDGLVVPSLGRASLGQGMVKWSFGDRNANHSTDRTHHAHKVDGGTSTQ